MLSHESRSPYYRLASFSILERGGGFAPLGAVALHQMGRPPLPWRARGMMNTTLDIGACLLAIIGTALYLLIYGQDDTKELT
jgi:hypothetical protein